MTIILFKKNMAGDHKNPNSAYRECIQYAAQHNLLVTHTLPYTEENHDEVLIYIGCLLASAQGTPNDLIAYEADDIRTQENKDIILPLVQGNLVNLHLTRFPLRFSYNSFPDHLERGAFKRLEEQAFWADLFEGYDSNIETI